MSEQVYEDLRRFLDGLPGGYPRTPDGVEMKILEKLFSPEEAKLVVCLRQFPEPARVIADRCGMTDATAEKMLDSMASKGLIFSLYGGKRPFYQVMQFVVGIYEFHVDSIDLELCELVEEYLDYLKDSARKQLRVVPVGSAIDTTRSVAAYDQVRALVKRQKIAAVAPCICRKEQGMMGNGCDKPRESCMTFGVGAQYIANTGKGREISIDEALAFLDRAEEQAMVLMPTNARDIASICSCCGCCCGVLRVLKREERPADHVLSGFQARIDPGLCTSCGTCVERCQMEAVIGDGEPARVDLARCIGCGLCVPKCPSGAVTMVARVGVPPLPANLFDLLAGMAAERGLGYGKLKPLLKRTNVPLMVKALPYLYGSGIARPIVNRMARRGLV